MPRDCKVALIDVVSGERRNMKRRQVNVRRPEVMELVQAEVEQHYRSPIVEKIRGRRGELTIGETTVRLAEQFGFCYGVERAIDLAYAARRVFPDRRLLAEEVEWRLAAAGCWLYDVRERGAAVVETDGRTFTLGRFDGGFAPAVGLAGE